MQFDYIILGGTGLLGSALYDYVSSLGASCLSIHSKNYEQHVGVKGKVLINCNGNSYRFRANQDPKWDFEASVASVQKSLFDFKTESYIYMSTIDVYNNRQDRVYNQETASIDYCKLDAYGFHKWVAERLVEKNGRNPLILRLGTLLGKGLKKGPIYDLLHQKPLFMSLDSTISFIDTLTVAKIAILLVERGISHEIFNVTGRGGARLRDLESVIPFSVEAQPEAEGILHKYDIANEKIHSLYPVRNSLEVAQNYIQFVLMDSAHRQIFSAPKNSRKT